MADVTHFIEWDPGVKRVPRVCGDGAGAASHGKFRNSVSRLNGFGDRVRRYADSGLSGPPIHRGAVRLSAASTIATSASAVSCRIKPYQLPTAPDCAGRATRT